MSQITSFSIGGITPAMVVETLTGNSGGPVAPTANNINVVGSGTINVVGNPGTSTLTISATGTTTLNYTNVNTSPYVVLPTDEYLSVDCSAIPIQINLPNAPATGTVYIIKDRTGNANIHNISVTTVGGVETVDLVTPYVMNTRLSSIEVIFNGANWEIF